MNIKNLISPDRVICSKDISSKKRVLEKLSELLASGQSGLTTREAFDTLVGRERLGSTGLGRGVALPHGRHSQNRQPVGAFVKVDKGVDFDAIDQQPVDLVLGLLVPEHFTNEHLIILARLAEMFSEPAFCEQLRSADTNQALYERLRDRLARWDEAADLPP